MIKVHKIRNGQVNLTVSKEFETKYKNNPLYEKHMTDCLTLLKEQFLYSEYNDKTITDMNILIDQLHRKFLIEVENYEYVSNRDQRWSKTNLASDDIRSIKFTPSTYF